jgi:micrococcal nuclease
MVMSLKFVFLLNLFALVSASLTLGADRLSIPGSSAELAETDLGAYELRKVLRVVDGDTIVVRPNEKVRLIGVDTPETVHPRKAVQCFGSDAKEFTRRMVESKSIRLAFDESNRARNHKDRYGRTLAYAYFDDGTMLNAELIRRGYAHAYTRFPFRYIVEFRAMERTACGRRIGIVELSRSLLSRLEEAEKCPWS